MKLIRAQIKLFRNILDSSEVDIDEKVTCLVGKNESGKTAFLHALYRLHPARTNVSFDSPSQYPAWLEKRHRQSGIDVDKEIPAIAIFELEAKDRDALEEHFGRGAVASKAVTVRRNYSNELTLGFDVDEAKAVASVLANVKLPKPYADNKTKLKTFAELTQMIEQMQKGEEGPDSLAKQGAATLQERATTMLGGKGFRDAVDAFLRKRVPRFFYFSDYSTLPYTVKIRELLEADEAKLNDEQLTALSLLRMAASDDDYLLNPDYELRKRELENVGNALTGDVLRYWTQNTELRVDMDITKEQRTNPQGQPIAVLDELKIRIRDNRHWLTLPFDEHSTGFRWFFSFLAAFSKFEYSDQPVVILKVDCSLPALCSLTFLTIRSVLRRPLLSVCTM